MKWRRPPQAEYHRCPGKAIEERCYILFSWIKYKFLTGHRLERRQTSADIVSPPSAGMVMYSRRFVISRVMGHLPMNTFRRCVQRYQDNGHIQSFTCLDQFLCTAFAQLTFREHLRDIMASRALLQMDQATFTHKSYFCTSENAVTSQIWIAVTVYMPGAVVKMKLNISADHYEIIQISSLASF